MFACFCFTLLGFAFAFAVAFAVAFAFAFAFAVAYAFACACARACDLAGWFVPFWCWLLCKAPRKAKGENFAKYSARSTKPQGFWVL